MLRVLELLVLQRMLHLVLLEGMLVVLHLLGVELLVLLVMLGVHLRMLHLVLQLLGVELLVHLGVHLLGVLHLLHLLHLLGVLGVGQGVRVRHLVAMGVGMGDGVGMGVGEVHLLHLVMVEVWGRHPLELLEDLLDILGGGVGDALRGADHLIRALDLDVHVGVSQVLVAHVGRWTL